jgi:hypothetical protein
MHLVHQRSMNRRQVARLCFEVRQNEKPRSPSPGFGA